MKIVQKNIKLPENDNLIPVNLTDETMRYRKEKAMAKMKERNLDYILVYADVEHGSNFEYLVGFFPRFEEALLLMSQQGDTYLIFGNENFNKTSKARIKATGLLCSEFSLPNQPNVSNKTLLEVLSKTPIKRNDKVGIIGWKLFPNEFGYDKYYFDVPNFILEAVRKIVKNDLNITNETDLFIGHNGIRTRNNANEIAHLEFGSSLASDAISDAMNKMEEGMTELELGDTMSKLGQHHSVVTIAASGERYIEGNMYPSANKVEVGDAIALTVGYRGGLSSRVGFAVNDAEELPANQKDYLTRVAKPYFKAYATWLEKISIGITGDEIFATIDAAFPRKDYGWYLCPGHLTATEEWMSSPIYEGSKERIKSGMVFQVDIIPSVKNYTGVSAESTVLIADDTLKEQIKKSYPMMWRRMENRRNFIVDKLGIDLSPDVLPMCNTVAYLRPFLLKKDTCFVIERNND